jgi:hypothetical protein
MRKFIREVAHKVRYAEMIYIMGPGETRFELQNEIENNKELRNIAITNSACEKMTRAEFEKETENLFQAEDV